MTRRWYRRPGVLWSIAALLVAGAVAAGAVALWPRDYVGDLATLDPCALLDADQLRPLGTPGDPDQTSYDACLRDITLPAGGAVYAYLRVHPPEPRLADAVQRGERRGDLTVLPPASKEVECAQYLALPDDNMIEVRITPKNGKPDLCGVGKQLTDTVSRRLTDGGMPHRPTDNPPNSLRRLDACTLLDTATLRRVPGIDPNPRDRDIGGWDCFYGSRDGYQVRPPAVEVWFSTDDPPTAATEGERITVGGREAYTRLGVGADDQTVCLVKVVHRDAPRPKGPGKEIVAIGVYARLPAPDQCGIARDMATIVAGRLPPP